MFNILKTLLVIATVSLISASTAKAQAQIISDPTSWTYEVKKMNGNLYEVIFHLTLDKGWHIWSMNPGGDGTQIAPSFTFDKNKNVQLDGTITEIGNKITEHMEGVDGDVDYYNNKVDYTQLVAVTGKAKLTGKHEYQVCNDRLCLPPKTLKFSINIDK